MTGMWDAAIEEARVSASVDQYELEAVEIRHPEWVGGDDLPASLRLVLDNREWNFQHEADAPLNPGQSVLYVPTAMRIVRPEQAEGQIGEVSLAFDFVSRAVLPWIDKALAIRADGQLTLRSWIASRNMTTGATSVAGPPREVLKGLIVRKISASATTIQLTASFKDLVNVGFPRRLFEPSEFPGLFG